MYDSKLFQLYQSLDKKGIRLFKKWLVSSAHNEHIYVQKLFDFIFKRRAYSAVSLQKRRAWKYLYGDNPYDDLRMRCVMSLAFQVLENFVRNKLSDSDCFYQKKILSQYLFEAKIEKQAHQKLQEAKECLAAQATDEFYYYHQYELEVLTFEVMKTQDRTRTLNIAAIIDNARLFFMITTLRYAYIALTHQNMRKTEYEVPMLASILEEIKKKSYKEYPILQIYYHGYHTLKEHQSLLHFEELKSYLEDTTLLAQQKREILLMCINYAAKQLNTGNITWVRQTFNLYKYSLEQDYLLEKGILSVFAYKNIVTLGLNLKEYDWVEHFIESYSQYLLPNLQENYKHYNTARLAFDMGNFSKAMSLLHQVEYDDLVLNIDAKVILLKIYYQEKYYDTLEAFLDSFNVFLHRKKALSYQKKNYLNLILFTKKILAISHKKETMKSLKKEIKNTLQVAERKWLLEQL